MYTKIILFFFWLIYIQNSVLSQQGIVSAGGNQTSNSGSISFSIGQISDRTNSNSSFTISEGIQQAYEIYTLSSSKLTFKFDVKIFPNPTSDVLQVSFSNLLKEEIEFQLFDLNGSLISNERITEEKINLNMSNFSIGPYLLKMYSSNKLINSYKIIKN